MEETALSLDRANTNPLQANSIRLTLFVSGTSVFAPLTIDSIVRICEVLGDRVKLDVVDVLTHPELSDRYGIVATPTLIRDDQTMEARVVGDIASTSELSSRILPELMDVVEERTDAADDAPTVIGRISCA
jgi:hypothetical protein